MKNRRVVELVSLAALAAGLIYGTWILPYRFPPQKFVVGASNELGFSNTVSFLAYLVCVPLLALLVSRFFGAPQESSGDVRGRGHLTDVVAAIVIVGHILLFGALYAYKGRFVFGEGLYFQSLLYRMSTGEIPYLDFSFYYGPLMLYPAYWLSRFVSLDLAYGIWFITTYVNGLVFLYVVLRVCLRDDRTRAFWFVLLSLGLFNPLTGLNETFTRYLFPTLVFLSATAFFHHGGGRRGFVTSLLLAAAIAYSFEVAALSVAAILALSLSLTVGPSVLGRLRTPVAAAAPPRFVVLARAAIVLIAGVAVSVAFFLLVDPSGRGLKEYPSIAEAYSGGAHNVPIYPNLPFLALAVITVTALGALWRVIANARNQFLALSAAAYAVIALIAQRAAFGAAEPSHFAYFGLSILFLALFLTTVVPAGHAARSWLAVALVVGIVLPMQYYHAMEFAPFFAQRLHPLQPLAASGGPAGPAGNDEDEQPATALDQDLRDVVRSVGTDRPYVMYEMEYASLPVYRDFGLRYATYFTMLITARDHAGIERAVDEVRSRRGIVVARKRDLAGLERPRQSTGVSHILDVLSGAHTAGSDLNAVLLKSRTRLTQPFLKFVETEYMLLYDHHGLAAYGPR